LNFAKQHASFSVKHLLDLYQQEKLNLEPGFQRESVWTKKDQLALIDTILRQLPLPNLFLWEHKEGHKIVFDVIDGKQRIEALLAFTRKRKPLVIKIDPNGDSDWSNQDLDYWTWKELQRFESKVARRLESYEFPVVVVRGSLLDIELVFIRINSTGKKLSGQEILHAKWYKNSDLLLAAESIAKSRKYETYFIDMGILSAGQITRMKAVELITELMLSIQIEDVLDRKKSLDRVMGNTSINKNTIRRLVREVKSVLDLIAKQLPELRTTRFNKPSDFYALFFAIWKMKRDGYQLKDKRATALAFKVLNQFSLSLTRYRDAFRGGKRYQLSSTAREYHNSVQAGTDTARHRRTRVTTIEHLLHPIYAQKDSKRLFSLEQKQLLWHSSKDKVCTNPKCRKPLTWKDVRMDHIKAHTKGGWTDLSNAQILCSPCNLHKAAQ
jgi:5-methylcytosine-specific restriction endonuclease McrA